MAQKNALSNKLSDDIKKNSSDKYKKITEFLVEPDQNLGINKIPIAWPIFVVVPGLLNIKFSSHKNFPACTKSAPCGPI